MEHPDKNGAARGGARPEQNSSGPENVAGQARSPRGRSAEDLEDVLSRSLQVGVLLSAAVTLLGLILLFATGRSGYPGSAFPHQIAAVLQGLPTLKPYAVIMTGLFILILTPVFRVFVSIFVFLRQRDWHFVAITALVFVILIISFLMGKVE